jgi:chromosome condensin MukBEF MukE localization factor
VIANPFSFSGFSNELFGEIDLDDIDVGKTTGTDDIDDNAFFEDFAIDSEARGRRLWASLLLPPLLL